MDTEHFKIIVEQFKLTNEPPQQIDGGPGGGAFMLESKV